MSNRKQWATGLSLSILGSAVWAQADTATATQTARTPGETLPEIVVQAPKKEATPDSKQHYQAVTTTAGKGKQALKDIPQSVTVVTEKLMDDKNADTLKAAMHTVSGIAFEAGEGGAIGDLIRLRGFTTRGDIFQDGMRDIAQYNRDTFNQDRIEVLRGSASMLYGRGSTGGIINQASKQPFLATQHEVEATVGTDNYVRLTGDFNIKTADDAALRINVMKTDADSFRNGPETHRMGVAPTFSWGIGTANEYSIGLYHLDYNDVPDYGFRWLNGRPVNAAVDRWYGSQSDYQRDSADYAVASHTHRFEDGGELKTSVRDGTYKRDLWATTAGLTGVSNVNAITDSSTVSRGNQTRAAQDHHTFVQTDYSGKAQWFGLQHDLLAGAELAQERTTTYSYTSIPGKATITWANVGGTNALVDTRIKQETGSFQSQTTGLYAQDTLHLSSQWKLLGGLRHDIFDGEYERAVGGPLS
ncbi:MAG: TonB-dependent receptor, partial [Burkholderiales bacterium]|nr:TonB-dependent receptor [Burkholderiales bacterium]